ncbi:MAG: hypothetical protein K8H88_23010, partial [Sandaracinaceae bacterium]|nr:hypothetical protein [Sandaracinaceae bacterium]
CGSVPRPCESVRDEAAEPGAGGGRDQQENAAHHDPLHRPALRLGRGAMKWVVMGGVLLLIAAAAGAWFGGFIPH